MSIRLKGIELNSFRAFEDNKNFNFINNNFNEISNLVVLYAPNGTGKTTFFDAIEWSLSGEIKRISNNKNILDIAKQERSYILKNKYSTSSVGTVELQFEDNTLLKVETKKLNGSRTIDYHSGKAINKTVSLTEVELGKVVETNLLTHDQIDAFLRSQNSEQRYDALSIFWDKEKESEDYKNIVFIVSEINKILEKHEKEIFILNEEITKVEINPKIWAEINRLKKAYVSIEDEKDILIDNDLNLQELYMESVKLKSKNENIISINEIDITKIEKLSKVIQEEYVKIPARLILSEERRSIQKEFVEIFTKIEKNKEKESQLLKQKIEINEHIRHCNFLIEYKLVFTSQQKEEIEAKLEREELIKERKKIEISILTTQVEIQEQESKLENQKKKKNELVKVSEDIRSLKKYPSLNHKSNQLKKEKKNMQKKKKIIEKKIEDLNLKVSKLLKINALTKKEFTQKDYSNNSEYMFVFDKAQMSSEICKHIKTSEKILEDKKTELISLEKLGSNLEQLKKLGYSIVASTKSSTCPLCNSDYKEFEKLINEINNNAMNLDVIASMNIEISELEKSLIILNTELDTSLLEIKNIIQEKIKKIETEINILNEQNIKLTFEMNNIEKEHLECEGRLNELIECMKKFDINIDKFEEQLYQNESSIKEKLSQIEIKYEEIKSKKLEKEILKTQNENIIENIDLKSQQVKKRISDIQENEQYILYQKKINHYKNDDVIDIIEFKKNNESNLDKIKTIEKKLLNDNEKLIGRVTGQNKIESIEKVKIYENKISVFKERKDSIEQESIELLGEIVNESYDFKLIKKKLEENISELKKKNEILIQIAGISSDFINETKVEVKKAELKELKEIYKILKSKSEELTKLKVTKLDFIKNKIENTFNLNIVNKIFQMIEPHPDFREISFKIDESNPDKLGLDIMCKRVVNEEEAPILYLSSAQVNILSLSIFLGTALENTDKLNTIFMDDPVQHLDSLNELSFIDLLRIISFQLGKQIIFSTHSQQFFNLCKRKLDDQYHNSSFIEINNWNSELG